MDRPALLAALVAASVGCTGSSSPAQSTRDASAASRADSSILVAADADVVAASADAGTPDRLRSDLGAREHGEERRGDELRTFSGPLFAVAYESCGFPH
jgi:hypothetical protein